MNDWFQSRPVAFLDGMLVVALGAALMLLLEVEKLLLRKSGRFDLR
jgi:hypothetical protein